MSPDLATFVKGTEVTFPRFLDMVISNPVSQAKTKRLLEEKAKRPATTKPTPPVNVYIYAHWATEFQHTGVFPSKISLPKGLEPLVSKWSKSSEVQLYYIGLPVLMQRDSNTKGIVDKHIQELNTSPTFGKWLENKSSGGLAFNETTAKKELVDFLRGIACPLTGKVNDIIMERYLKILLQVNLSGKSLESLLFNEGINDPRLWRTIWSLPLLFQDMHQVLTDLRSATKNRNTNVAVLPFEYASLFNIVRDCVKITDWKKMGEGEKDSLLSASFSILDMVSSDKSIFHFIPHLWFFDPSPAQKWMISNEYKEFENQVRTVLQAYWKSKNTPPSPVHSPTIYKYNNLLRNQSIIYHPSQSGDGKKKTPAIWWLSNPKQIEFYRLNSSPRIFALLTMDKKSLIPWIEDCVKVLDT